MQLNFCTECAQPLRQENATKYICSNGHIFWNNAKAAVGVVLLKGDQVLLSKRGQEPKKGKYDLPGGFVDHDENAYDCARRELKEETGLDVDDLTPIDSGIHQYIENITSCDVIFICTKWHGTPKAADDVAALEWKPIDFIDSDQFAWRYPDLVQKLKSLAGQP